MVVKSPCYHCCGIRDECEKLVYFYIGSLSQVLSAKELSPSSPFLSILS